MKDIIMEHLKSFPWPFLIMDLPLDGIRKQRVIEGILITVLSAVLTTGSWFMISTWNDGNVQKKSVADMDKFYSAQIEQAKRERMEFRKEAKDDRDAIKAQAKADRESVATDIREMRNMMINHWGNK